MKLKSWVVVTLCNGQALQPWRHVDWESAKAHRNALATKNPNRTYAILLDKFGVMQCFND